MSKKLKKITIALAAAITMSVCSVNTAAIESPWAKTPNADTASGNVSEDRSDNGDSANSDKQGIHLSRTSVNMTEGEKVSVKLVGAGGKIKWTVSDKNVFTYSKGVITAKGSGKGTLTAEYNGRKYKCTVTVEKNVDGFGADKYSLKLQKGVSGNVKINTAGKEVMVMADNANICSIKCSAIVNGCFDLTVTAKEKGSCNLIVYDVNNKKSKFTIKLTVTGKSSEASAVNAEKTDVRQTAAETEAAAENSDFLDEVLRLCNEERESAGLSPLEKSDSLTESAAVRAEEISGKFSHTRPDGTDCFTAVKERGRTFGENIAVGYENPEQVVEGWMNSPGHRANILNPDFTKIGIGYYESGNYWVQLFAG